MSINKRVFGTPITGSVRTKLEARQASGSFNSNVQFGESLTGNLKTVMIPKNSELSSKTPFARMWTSVKVIDPAVAADAIDEAIAVTTNNGKLNHDEVIAQLSARLETEDKFQKGGTYPKAIIKPIYDNDGKIIKYGIFDTRDQIDYVRKIYVVGNHAYQEKYGTVDTNDSLQPLDGGTSDEYEKLVPQELKDNPLLKPQSGITSIRSETMGALGITKETTVDFTVHNFYDYDRVFSKYFLRPGATIFVDFGWDSIENLYDPKELITSDNIQNYLYGDPSKVSGQIKGQITKYQGDLEILEGIVTNYSAKIQPNGSVQCSVTLTSANSALLSFKLDVDVVNKIKQWLTRGVFYLGLQDIVQTDDPDDLDKDFRELSGTPDSSFTSQEEEQYEKNIRLLALKELSAKSGPDNNSVRTGIFLESMNADNVYISIGLFEDLIINSKFGFGKDTANINNGQNLQVKMDSSYSFATWNKTFLEKQHVLFQVPEDPPKFVYPLWWGSGKPFEDIYNKGSYSFQQKKYPFEEYDEEELKNQKNTFNAPLTAGQTRQTNLDYAGWDKKRNRIPIREIFVSVDVIIDAMEQNDNVRAMLKQIFDDMNDYSEGMLNLQIKLGDSDTELKIIDRNFNKNIEDAKTVVNVDKDLFTFNVMSPNSIIKDYNLEFKLPTGNIGNMYAIQAMSHGNNLFSVDMDVDSAVAIKSVDDEATSIIYEPDLGTHTVEQLIDRANGIVEYDVYNDVKKAIDTNIYNIATEASPEIIDAPLSSSNAVTTKPGSQTTLSVVKRVDDKQRISDNENILTIRNLKVAKDFTDYYRVKNMSEEVHKKRPNLLPFALSLTTYGIGSIIPGDTFKVDYLPEMYQENTYVQTMKVTNDINTSGWYTTLDTQFRLLPDKKTVTYQNVPKDSVRLSPTVLVNQKFSTLVGYDTITSNVFKDIYKTQETHYFNQIAGALGGSGLSDVMFFETFAGFMTDLTIEHREGSRVDYMIRFRTTSEVEEIYENEDEDYRKITPTKRLFVVFSQRYLPGAVSFARNPGFELVRGAGIKVVDEGDGDFDFEEHDGTYGFSGAKGGVNQKYSNFTVGFRPVVYKNSSEYVMLVQKDRYTILDPSWKNYSNLLNFVNNYAGFNSFDPISGAV